MGPMTRWMEHWVPLAAMVALEAWVAPRLATAAMAELGVEGVVAVLVRPEPMGMTPRMREEMAEMAPMEAMVVPAGQAEMGAQRVLPEVLVDRLA